MTLHTCFGLYPFVWAVSASRRRFRGLGLRGQGLGSCLYAFQPVSASRVEVSARLPKPPKAPFS